MAVCIWLCSEIVSWQYVFAAIMNVKADMYTEQQKMCLKYVRRCFTLEYIFEFILLNKPPADGSSTLERVTFGIRSGGGQPVVIVVMNRCFVRAGN